MIRILYIIISSLSLMTVSAAFSNAQTPPSTGISVYVLRLIYSQEDKQGIVLTTHNNSSAPYLMQSWIRPVDLRTGDVDLNWQGTPVMPFVVTPPLSRLEANQTLTLRIRRNDVQLPDDRESVFFISMKTIPALPHKPEQGKMVMTVVSNLKLFYRPVGLAKRAVAEMAPKLTFHLENNLLTATNPTPYWLTFSRLSVGSSVVEKSALRLMVPPFGQQSYPLPTSASGNVMWQLIDEDGWDTPAAQQSL